MVWTNLCGVACDVSRYGVFVTVSAVRRSLCIEDLSC